MRVPAVALAAFVLLNGCVAAPARDDVAVSKPFHVVVHGDSFTAALDLGRGDRPELSWATGTEFASLARRILEERPEAAVHNVAFSGARMRDVPSQAERATTGADLLIVFLGINDMCMGATSQGISRDTDAALALVGGLHPDAQIVVFAIPDLWRLHELHVSEPAATALWSQIDTYCPEFFNPVPSPFAAGIAADRLASMNEALRSVAAAHDAHFSEATLWPDWTLDDFAGDYFHPNVEGETRLAKAAWPAVAPFI